MKLLRKTLIHIVKSVERKTHTVLVAVMLLFLTEKLLFVNEISYIPLKWTLSTNFTIEFADIF